jgi:AraC-like DNA-binding protein
MPATAYGRPLAQPFDSFTRVHWQLPAIWAHGHRVDRAPMRAMPAAGADACAVRDRCVARALALLRERAAEPWTVQALARQVGLSRSALHERFVEQVGRPPMRYLADWRVRLGAALLRDGDDKVACVALDVGYESEAAFARAFKRLMGKPPAAWRRDARRDTGSGDASAMHRHTSRQQSRAAPHSAGYDAQRH